MFNLVKPRAVKYMLELVDQGKLALKLNAYLHFSCFSKATRGLPAYSTRDDSIKRNLLRISERL